MQPIIELNHLSFSYGHQAVLNDLNLSINAGEIFGLVGPNGAGKTTLLNLIQGILPSKTATIKTFGGQPGRLAAKEVTATMFQQDLRLENIKTSEFIELFAAQATNPASPEEIIKRLGLTDVKDRLLTKLSGGQRRKVSFAATIVSNPKLLFLDEPTVGMDAQARQDFWQTIDHLRQRGVTIVMTSHYLEEIQTVADRIAILQDGRFSYVGSWQNLQNHHADGKLIFSTDLAVSLFQRLPGVTKASHADKIVTLVSEDTDLTLWGLLPFIEDCHDLTIARNSLESIFLEMTTKEAH